MRAFNARFKRIEAAVAERYAKIIEEMEEKKFITALKSAPPWVLEAYAFYFTMFGQVSSLKESQPNAPVQGIGRPMHPKAYAFLLESVEELLREHRGERVGREEIKALFFSVIKNSPYLGEESRKILLKAANATHIEDQDLKGICGEEN